MSKPKVDPLEAWLLKRRARALVQRDKDGAYAWDVARAAGMVRAYDMTLQEVRRAQRKAKKERTR